MVTSTETKKFSYRLFFQDSHGHSGGFKEQAAPNISAAAFKPEASENWVKLTVMQKGESQDLTLRLFPIHIGRQNIPGGITLDDKNVSSRHAIITFTANNLTITDSGSKNGTHVNGRKLAENEIFILTKGAAVKIGRAEILVNDFSSVDVEHAAGTEVFMEDEQHGYTESNTEALEKPSSNEKQVPQFCGNCGKKNINQSKFCMYCGTKFPDA